MAAKCAISSCTSDARGSDSNRKGLGVWSSAPSCWEKAFPGVEPHREANQGKQLASIMTNIAELGPERVQ